MDASLRESIFTAHGLGDFPGMEAFVPTKKSACFAAWSNEFRTTELTEYGDDRFVEIGAIWGCALRNTLAYVFVCPAFEFLANV